MNNRTTERGVDLVTFGETMLRLSPPDGERLEVTTDLEMRAAGAESNVAVAAQRLGADTAWMSKLPDSPLGRRVVGELQQHGVETAVAWSDDQRQGVYFIEQAGAPRGVNVIYDRADAAVTTAEPAELALDRVRDARAFHVSGITPALSETLADTTAVALAKATDSGTTTVFDVNYRSKLWSPEAARDTVTELFPDVDVLVVAARDARNVLGEDGSSEEIAGSLAAEWEFETVVVTRGGDGVVAWHEGELYEQPAFEAETVDPIGTGDAFVGAFLATRLDGEDVPAALEYGAATAAIKRTIPGDMAITSRAEVETVMNDGIEEISR